jgi:hypothetical protein
MPELLTSAIEVEESDLETAAAVQKRIRQPTHDDIARLAHSYWLRRNADDGSAEDDWHRAEQELRSRSKASPLVPVAVPRTL